MPKLGTTQLTGVTGEAYTFNVYDKKMRFNDFIPGVYLISRQSENADDDAAHQPIYVGESDNVDRTLQSHDKISCFDEHDFNRICFYRAANPETRKSVYNDLKKALKPVCNE